jgi:hypothetical protein
MTKLLALALLCCATLAAPTSAHADRVDRRQDAQRERIRDGARSGDLTGKEARALRRDQKRIRRMEHRAKANGQVSPHETRRLEHAQDQASKKIYRQKHDRQHR